MHGKNNKKENSLIDNCKRQEIVGVLCEMTRSWLILGEQHSVSTAARS